jgi:crotonobetainyl-CoA:carnitine CoA-transferase CaiB-like acyl-CoA transferase
MALARLQVDPSPIRVDVGLYESAFSVIEIAAQTVLLAQRFEAESPDMVGSPLAYPYHCSDGGALVINIYGRGVWERTCAAIGRADLTGDPRFIETFARYQFAQELRELLDNFCASHQRDEAIARLWAQRIPSAPILDVAELVKNEQVLARGIIHGSAVASPFLINGHRDPMASPSAPEMEAAVRAFCQDQFTVSYAEDRGEVRIVLR